MSAWVLPDHIADVLPSQARLIEAQRRALLDTARTYGYQLVIAPLVEHIDSLLTGSGKALDLQTFKLVDLLSGRTLGVRADTTQQVARMDAHLLNHPGVTRLCYCGPVLHTSPQQPHASREPLQFGAELYGSSDIHADLEVLTLALDAIGAASQSSRQVAPVVDLSDARIVPALLAQVDAATMRQVDTSAIQDALITKNANALHQASAALPAAVVQQLTTLLELYGDAQVLERARQHLPNLPAITQALGELQWLAQHIGHTHPHAQVLFDLADSRGYAYYSGMRFALYGQGCTDALVRGGRYDEVGAVFGRKRPAVGFSLDVKTLAALQPAHAIHRAIGTRYHHDPDWRSAVQRLRAAGEVVLVAMPDDTHACHGWQIDRELVHTIDGWQVQATNEWQTTSAATA